MRLSFRLAVVKDRRKNKKKVRGGRRSIVKADSKSATAATTTCWEIPEEILVEILVRLPADSLMRFKCVSRRWSSLISSRYFTNYFFKFSSSSRRCVCMYMVEKVCCYGFNSYMLISSSSLSSNLDIPTRGLVNCNNLDGTTTSFLQLNPLTSLPVTKYSIFVNAVRGLMCFRMGEEREEIRIINFTTKQFLSLPLEFPHDGRVWNYFGYDSVNDEYKVLSTVSCKEDDKWRSSKTQVFVLGAKASWRNTKSPPPPQRPVEGFSVNINNVLYIGVWSDDIYVLMSFDFNSEDFNLIQFPTDSNVNRPRSLMHNLMNYQGQVALFDYSRLNTENILDLWVLEDTGNSKWSHKVFALPCDQFRQSLDLHDLTFSMYGIEIRGTGRSGEVTLSKRFGSRNKKNTCVIYDLERDCIAKEIVIEPQNHRSGSLEMDVWDDVESIMYLEA